ncbi:MAG TPA: HD domain-containing protein [Clostridiales bacterium]|nr:HD domain-containing protein [Clostridiales bacterium]
MRIISLNDIKGSEVLAKDIRNSSGNILIHAGTIIKKEYVPRLKKLKTEFVFIEDELSKGIELSNSLEIKLKEELQDTLQDVLEKYINQSSNEVDRIVEIANEVIENILKDINIVYSLNSIREKSENTYSHSLNVCILSVILAINMDLDGSLVNDIAIGSLIHDVGYSYVNFDYLEGTLDEFNIAEKNEVMRHVIYGYEIVERLNSISTISKGIVLKHHERLDGSGYPFRLTAEKIEIESKIVAVCDEFDSMVYANLTNKMKVKDALDYMVSQADVKFDIDVINALILSVAAYPTGALVLTNRGETGIVLRQNRKCPTRPVIRILRSEGVSVSEKWIEKDLTDDLTLFIEEIIIKA